ncbi:MAG: sulfatase-like hydrolase/transferase [Victivallales bacterium]|nr:sulfatase-like hydrolase/transferase [Victivallales bacterium]
MKKLFEPIKNWYNSSEEHRTALHQWLMIVLYLHILFLPECFALPHYVNFRNPFHLYRQNLAFLLLLSGLPLLFNRIFGRIIIVFYGFIGLYNVIQFYAICRFRLKMDGVIFQILEATNHEEVSEFSHSCIFWYDFIPFTFVVLLTALLAWRLRKPTQTCHRIGLISFVLFLVVAFIPLCKGDWWWFGKRNGLSRFVSSYFASYTGFSKTIQEAISSPKLPEDIHRCSHENQQDSPSDETVSGNILGIVVVGESARRKNMECYGYPRPTTPFLTARKDQLLLFDNVLSAATSTFRCCVYDFTLAQIGSFSKPELSLCDLLLAGGYKVHLYSIQHASGKHESMGLLFQHANKKLFLREMGGATLDMSLLQYVHEVASLPPTEPIMLFLHTMGSHRQADKRYPPEYAYFDNNFRDECNNHCEELSAEYINKYDNSIRYTDAFLEGIIKEVENQRRPAFVLFFSDHAETLHSKDSNVNFRDANKPETYEIPFVLYLNQAYIDCYPTFSGNLKKNLHLPFQADNTFFAIASLAQVTFNHFPEEKNIFSPAYIPSPRYLQESPKCPYPND